MKELCRKGNYVAVDCDIGAFTLDSIELLLKIHSLRNVKHAVLKEQQWLKKEINLPDSACSYSKEHLACYAEKIFNTPNHHSPYPVIDVSLHLISPPSREPAGSTFA